MYASWKNITSKHPLPAPWQKTIGALSKTTQTLSENCLVEISKRQTRLIPCTHHPRYLPGTSGYLRSVDMRTTSPSSTILATIRKNRVIIRNVLASPHLAILHTATPGPLLHLHETENARGFVAPDDRRPGWRKRAFESVAGERSKCQK